MQGPLPVGFRTLAVVDATALTPTGAPIAATPRAGTVSAPLGTVADAARLLAGRRLVVLTGGTGTAFVTPPGR